MELLFQTASQLLQINHAEDQRLLITGAEKHPENLQLHSNQEQEQLPAIQPQMDVVKVQAAISMMPATARERQPHGRATAVLSVITNTHHLTAAIRIQEARTEPMPTVAEPLSRTLLLTTTVHAQDRNIHHQNTGILSRREASRTTAE